MNAKRGLAQIVKRKKNADTVPCAHAVKFEYWSDTDLAWHGKLTFTEFRQGRQYGGAVVEEFSYKGRNWRTNHKNFMKLVRTRVAKSLNTFWT